jgi:hypothetical protein
MRKIREYWMSAVIADNARFRPTKRVYLADEVDGLIKHLNQRIRCDQIIFDTAIASWKADTSLWMEKVEKLIQKVRVRGGYILNNYPSFVRARKFQEIRIVLGYITEILGKTPAHPVEPAKKKGDGKG